MVERYVEKGCQFVGESLGARAAQTTQGGLTFFKPTWTGMGMPAANLALQQHGAPVLGASRVCRDELRPLAFQRRYTSQAPGSVLVTMGRTMVLCTCCVDPTVPPFLVGAGKGWLSAEYGMLPGSTSTRKPRACGRISPYESPIATRTGLSTLIWRRA